MTPSAAAPLALALGALGLWVSQRRNRAISETLAMPGSAFALATVRVVAFVGLLATVPTAFAEVGGPWRTLYTAACTLGAVGLFTRFAALVAVVVGGGLYGFVSPLLGAAAILGASACADVLALDGIPGAWRRADAHRTAPPAPADVYGAPLRAAWALVGLAFLFPGSGATSPVVALVAFVAFVFSLATRGWQRVAALIGLIVAFWAWPYAEPQLRGWPILLLAFVDWSAAFRLLGKRLFPKPLVIVNDGDCGFCRRAVATMRSFDVLKRIDWVASNEPIRLREFGLDEIADAGEIEHFTAVTETDERMGFDAYRLLAARVPLFWPLVPFLWLPPVAALGRAIYDKVEASRGDINPEPLASVPAPSLWPVGIVGGMVLVASVAAILVR